MTKTSIKVISYEWHNNSYYLQPQEKSLHKQTMLLIHLK